MAPPTPPKAPVAPALSTRALAPPALAPRFGANDERVPEAGVPRFGNRDQRLEFPGFQRDPGMNVRPTRDEVQADRDELLGRVQAGGGPEALAAYQAHLLRYPTGSLLDPGGRLSPAERWRADAEEATRVRTAQPVLDQAVADARERANRTGDLIERAAAGDPDAGAQILGPYAGDPNHPLAQQHLQELWDGEQHAITDAEAAAEANRARGEEVTRLRFEGGAFTTTPGRAMFDAGLNAFMSMPVQTVRAFGIAADAVEYLINGEVDENALVGAMDDVQGALNAAFPGDQMRHGQFLVQLASGAGSLASFFMGGLVGRAVAGRVGQNAATGALGGGAQGAAQYDDALLHDATGAQRYGAFLAGIGLGMTELVPIDRALGRINEGTGGMLARVFRNAPASAAEEALQEAIQSVGTDIAAQRIYDAERTVNWAAVGENAMIGAILGVVMGGATAIPGGGNREPAGFGPLLPGDQANVEAGIEAALNTPPAPPASPARPAAPAAAPAGPATPPAPPQPGVPTAAPPVPPAVPPRPAAAPPAPSAGAVPPVPPIGRPPAAPVVEPAARPNRVADGDTALLLAAGYTPDEINDMAPAEIRQNVQEAREMGVEAEPVGTAGARVDVAQAADVRAAERIVADPTPAQAEAGNYQKGHIRFQGLDISIETAQGGTRRGTGPDGQPWEVQMPGAYGYIRRTGASDGDQLDVLIGDNLDAGNVYVIDQNNLGTGKFDEPKIIVGANSEAEARDLYMRSFSDRRGAERIGGIGTIPAADLRRFVGEGDFTRPVVPQITATPAASSPANLEKLKEATEEPPRTPAAPRPKHYETQETITAPVRMAKEGVPYFEVSLNQSEDGWRSAVTTIGKATPFNHSKVYATSGLAIRAALEEGRASLDRARAALDREDGQPKSISEANWKKLDTWLRGKMGPPAKKPRTEEDEAAEADSGEEIRDEFEIASESTLQHYAKGLGIPVEGKSRAQLIAALKEKGAVAEQGGNIIAIPKTQAQAAAQLQNRGYGNGKGYVTDALFEKFKAKLIADPSVMKPSQYNEHGDRATRWFIRIPNADAGPFNTPAEMDIAVYGDTVLILGGTVRDTMGGMGSTYPVGSAAKFMRAFIDGKPFPASSKSPAKGKKAKVDEDGELDEDDEAAAVVDRDIAASTPQKLAPDEHPGLVIKSLATGREETIQPPGTVPPRKPAAPDLVWDDAMKAQAVADLAAAPPAIKEAIDEDVKGVHTNSLRNLDQASYEGQFTFAQVTKAWEKTRELIRKKHGDVVTLYRADAPPPRRVRGTRTVYMADLALAPEFAEAYRPGGDMASVSSSPPREMLAYRIPVDDIVAVYALDTVKGKPAWYREFIVRLPDGGLTGGTAAKLGPTLAQRKAAKAAYGAGNKLVSKDRAAELRAKLKAKLGTQLSSGIDPEILAIGVELAAFHIEAGARKFLDMAKAVSTDLGTTMAKLRPYLRSWYNGARDMMEDAGLDIAGMDSPDQVRDALKEVGGVDGETGESVQRPAPEVPAGEQAGAVQKPQGKRGAEPAPAERGPDGDGNVPLDRDPDGAVEGSAGRPDPALPADRRDPDDRGGNRPGRGRVPAKVSEAEKARQQAAALNYRITPDDKIGQGGPKEKVRANIEAIRLLKLVTGENRAATEAEKRILVKYVGWGAFAQDVFSGRKPEWAKEAGQLKDLLTPDEYASARASTLNAHYTSEEVIRGVWAAVNRLGFKGGRALEPSAGVGHFIGLNPNYATTNFSAVELDPVTGGIAKLLYAGSDVNVTGFEKFDRPDNFYDLAISNVPFGDYKINDPAINGAHLIHDYFFLKAIEKVRPGGIVAFITLSGTLDKANDSARRRLDKKAEFLGAIRLPGGKKGAFAGNAGTEVTTDIIFLRKRIPGVETTLGKPWLETKEVKTPDGPTHINEYFAATPLAMLGEMRLQGTMYAAASPVLIGPGLDLDRGIAWVAKEYLPENVIPDANAPGIKERAETVAAKDGVKEGAFFLGDDGKLFIKQRGVGVPADLSAADIDKVKRLAEIRGYLNTLLDRNTEEDHKKVARRALNTTYDAFVKKHGPIGLTKVTESQRAGRADPIVIRRQPNFSAFRSDPDAFKVLALEHYDEEKHTATKAAIFTRDVVKADAQPEIRSPADTIAVSLDRFGKLLPVEIAKMLGRKPGEAGAVMEELGDLVFLDPNGDQWTPVEEYLSGDVLTKLNEATAAATGDRAYQRNVEALKKVQPTRLTATDIMVNFGAPWVPVEVYEAFLNANVGGTALKVYREPKSHTWAVRGTFGRDAMAKYGTDRADVQTVVTAALNNQQIRIVDKQSDGSTVFNEKATQEANIKVKAVRVAFSGDIDTGVEGWVFLDPARRTRLEDIYNERYNRYVPQISNGGHLTLPGLAATIARSDGTIVPFVLNPHQKNAVWRTIRRGNTLYAHVVGAGKTFTMIASGMEQRRLGLIKRPMYVVPNHMLEQFSREFLQAYPGAAILVADKESMSAAKRKSFAGRMAAQEWDAIIITHDAFGRIGMSEAFEKEFIQNEIDEYLTAIEEAKAIDKRSPTVKQLESAKKKMEARLQKLLNAEAKDEGATFEELGVDFLYVDEAHLFKNLQFPTKMTRAKGLGGTASQRASGLFMKIRYLEGMRPNRTTVFATGTPISNSIAEAYTMQRYLQLEKLRELGLESFDAWAATFGEVVTKMELAPNGRTLQPTSAFSKFTNVPELVAIYSQVADTQTADMLKLPRPELKVQPDGKRGITVVEASMAAQEEAYTLSLIARSEKVKGKRAEKGGDNMLKIVSEGRKVATDFRLIDAAAPVNPNGKIPKLVRNIKRIWDESHDNRSAQMVFLDMGTPKKAKGAAKAPEPELDTGELLEGGTVTIDDDGNVVTEIDLSEMLASSFNLYEDIRERLVASGIPKKQIAFIHEATDDQKKTRLFDRVKSGDVRVLIGSTGKMGVGTNVQTRLLAMHHVDAPWKPAEIEQRDGRILRQGNMNPEVEIFRYITKRSFDAFMWQALERKAKAFALLTAGTRGSRHMEDVDDALPEAAQLKAAASGDPRIMEHAVLGSEVQNLEVQRRVHERTINESKWRLKETNSNLESLRGLATARDSDAAAVQDVTGDRFAMDLSKIGKGTITKAEDAGKALVDFLVAKSVNVWNGRQVPTILTPGKLSGFDVEFHVFRETDRTSGNSQLVYVVGLKRDSDYVAGWGAEALVSPEADPIGMVGRFTARLRTVVPLAAETNKRIAELEAAIPGLTEQSKDKPFPQEARFQESRQKLAQLTKDLATPPPKPAEPPPNPALAQSAWHGSGAPPFPRFSTDFMGTGEGNQSFGWGLYFAGIRELAEYYRQQVGGRPRLEIKGAPSWLASTVPEGFDDQVTSSAMGWVESQPDLMAALDIGPIGNLTREQAAKAAREIAPYAILRVIRQANFRTDEGKSDPFLVVAGDSDRAADGAAEVSGIVGTRGEIQHRVHAALARALHARATLNRPGSLYKVALPEDDVLIHWDKRFSEQPAKVQEAFKRLGISGEPGVMGDPDSDNPFSRAGGGLLLAPVYGREAYERLVSKYMPWRLLKSGSKMQAARTEAAKKASLALRDLGVLGTKYLNGVSRGKGDGDYNFVIFDDSAIKIEETIARRGIGGRLRDTAAQLANDMQSIAGRIAGLPKAQIIFHDRIQADPGIRSQWDEEQFQRAREQEDVAPVTDTFGGLYRHNPLLPAESLIEIAMADKFFDPRSTAIHESWHHVEFALLTPDERARLYRDIFAPDSNLVRLAMEHTGQSERFIRKLPMYEITAIAFERYVLAKEGNLPLRGFHIQIRLAFDRLLQFLRQVRQMLLRQGIESADDVFERARLGQYAKREAVSGQREVYDAAAFRSARNDLAPALGSPLASAIPSVIANGGRSARARAEGFLNRVGRMGDKARVTLQDMHLMWKRIEQSVEEETGTKLPFKLRAYMALNRFPGRKNARIADLREKHLEPLAEAMTEAKVSRGQLDTYLKARHAKERNDEIRAINPDNDNGSGFTWVDPATGTSLEGDLAVDAYMATLSPTMQAELPVLAARVYALRDYTLNLLVEAGLLSQDMADQWRIKYPNYVPLRGHEMDGRHAEPEDDYEPARPRFGRGMDVRGAESRRAFGRNSEADSPLAYLFMQAEQAIVRAEKNRVLKVIKALIEAHPDSSLWAVVRVVEHKSIDPITGLLKITKVRPPGFDDRAEFFHALKIGGKTTWIEFRGPMGHALSHAIHQSGKEFGPVLNAVSKVTRFWATLQTARNPEFALVNPIRDFQAALLNIGDLNERMPKRMRRRMTKNMPKAVKGAFKYLRDPDSSHPDAVYFNEFRLAGGMMTWAGLGNIEQIKSDIDKLLKKGTGVAGLRHLWSGLKGLDKWLMDLNTALENAVRMSAYAVLRQEKDAAGNHVFSQAEAANITADLTVNFYRHGEIGPVLNLFWVFANASTQGIVRVAQAWHKSKKVKIATAAIVSAGFWMEILNSWLADDDDEGRNAYDDIEDHIKERNLIIMWPGSTGYTTIPLPFVYNAFYTAGRNLASIFRGRMTIPQAMGSTIRGFLDAANPLGTSATWLQWAAPTFLDPIAQLTENRSFFGGTIYPTRFPGDHDPLSETFWATTPQFYVDVSRALNRVNLPFLGIEGGNMGRSGSLDISPEGLQHMIEFAIGGLGRFTTNTGKTIARLINGEEVLPEELPFLRRFYGNVDSSTALRNVFYEEWDDIAAARNEVRDLRAADLHAEADRAEDQYRPELRAYAAYNDARQDLTELTTRRREIERDEALTGEQREERLREIDDRQRDIIRRAMQIYQNAQERAAAAPPPA